MNEKMKRLNPIAGLMPDPSIKYVGCPFADRCPHKMAICETQKPQPVVTNGHMIKCHLFSSKPAGDNK
jgi:peptide/nickel transport system ATP-binding protein